MKVKYHLNEKESHTVICVSSSVAWGSYFDHALAWEKRLDDPNVMIVTYEELKQVEQPNFYKVNMKQFATFYFHNVMLNKYF